MLTRRRRGCRSVAHPALLPLTADGLGAVLRPGRRAALAWAELIDDSDELTLYQPPQLDILTSFPTHQRLSDIDHASARALDAGMHLPPDQALYLATYTADAGAFTARGHDVTADQTHARILRSVLMKPETDTHIPALHRQLIALTH